MEICVNEIQIILEVHLIIEVEYYQKLSRSWNAICYWENFSIYVIQAGFTYTMRTDRLNQNQFRDLIFMNNDFRKFIIT